MDTIKIILRCFILHFNSTFKLPTHQRSQRHFCEAGNYFSTHFTEESFEGETN